jgi:hypothetical protein
VSPPLEDEAVLFSRLLAAAVVASTVYFLPPSAPASAQGTTPSQPILKNAKERGASPLAEVNPAGGGMSKQQRLLLCIESWDTQTHMSKREWRVACERSVKDYPDAFN